MKEEKKNPPGQPTLYKKEYDEQVYKLCLLKATDKELADFFGICESTLNNWKLAHPSFLESLRAGKEIADAGVAKKLIESAMGYEHEEEKVFCHEGQIITHRQTKHYPPNPTSLIFWLKNRQSAKWRDKQDVEHSGQVDILQKAVENIDPKGSAPQSKSKNTLETIKKEEENPPAVDSQAVEL